MKTLLIVIGIASFIIGIWTRISKSRYEFNNRTDGGVIQHQNYRGSFFHKLGKGVANVFIIGGIVLTIYGFMYDPFPYPKNWNSLSQMEKRAVREQYNRRDEIGANKVEVHKILSGKNFDDWAKELEKETGLSHLYWRDVADSTAHHTSFQEQMRLMRKGSYQRIDIQSIKKQYEDPNGDPLQEWIRKQKERQANKKAN